MKPNGESKKESPEILVPVIMIHPPPEEEKLQKSNLSKKNLPPIVSKTHPVHGKEKKKKIDIFDEETVTTPVRRYIDTHKYTEAVDILVSLLSENEEDFEHSVEIYHLLLKCYNCLNEVEKQIIASFDFLLKFSSHVLLKTLPPKLFEFIKWIRTQRRSVLSSIFPPHPTFQEEKQELIDELFESGQTKCENLVKQFTKYSKKPIDFARNLIRKRKMKEKNDPGGMRTIGRLFGCLYRSLKGMSEKFPIVRSLIEISCINLILENGLVKTGEKDEEGVSGMMLVRFAANTFPQYFEWDGCLKSAQTLAKSAIRINSCDKISCEKYYFFYQILPLLKGKKFSNIFPMTQEGFRLSLSDPTNPNYVFSRKHGISFYLWKYLMSGKSWEFFDEQVEIVQHEDPLFDEAMNLFSRLDEALRGEQRIIRWKEYEFLNHELNDEIEYYGRFLLPFVKAVYLFLVDGDPVDASAALSDAGQYVKDAGLLEEIHCRFFQGVLAGRNLEDLSFLDPKQAEDVSIEKTRLKESLDFFTRMEQLNSSFFNPFSLYVKAESRRWENAENKGDLRTKSLRAYVEEVSYMYLEAATSFQESGHLMFVGIVLERRLQFVWEEGFQVDEYENCLKSCVKAWADLKAPLVKKNMIRKYGNPSSQMLQRIEEENERESESEEEEELEEEDDIEEIGEVERTPLKERVGLRIQTPSSPEKEEEKSPEELSSHQKEDKERASYVIGKIFDQLRSPTSPVEEEKVEVEEELEKKKESESKGLPLPSQFVPPTPLSIGGRGMLDDDSIFGVVEEKKQETKTESKEEEEEEETISVGKLEEIVEVGESKVEEVEVRKTKENSPKKRVVKGPKSVTSTSTTKARSRPLTSYASTTGSTNVSPNRPNATTKILSRFIPFASKTNKVPSENLGGRHRFVKELQKTLLNSCFSKYEFLNKQLGLHGYLFPKSTVSQIVTERNRKMMKRYQKSKMIKNAPIPPPNFRIRKIGKFLIQNRFLHDDEDDDEDEDEAFLNSSIVFKDPEVRKRTIMMLKRKQKRKKKKEIKRAGYRVHELYEVFEPNMYREEVLTIYDRMQRLFLKRKFEKVMKLYLDNFTMNDHQHPTERKKSKAFDNTHKTRIHEGSSILQKAVFYLGKARRGWNQWNEVVDRKTMLNWKGEQLCRYLYVVSKLFRMCRLPMVWKGEIPVGWDGRPKMFGQARPPLKAQKKEAQKTGEKKSSEVIEIKSEGSPRKRLLVDETDDFFENLEKDEEEKDEKRKKLSFLDFGEMSPTSEVGVDEDMSDMYNRLNRGVLKSKKPIGPVELSPSLSERKKRLLEEKKEREREALELKERMEMERKKEKKGDNNVGVKVKKSIGPLISGVGKVGGGISSWMKKKKSASKKEKVGDLLNKPDSLSEKEDLKKNKKKEGKGTIFKKWFGGDGKKKKKKKKKKKNEEAELAPSIPGSGRLFPPKKKRKKRISQLEMRRRTYNNSPNLFRGKSNRVVPASAVRGSSAAKTTGKRKGQEDSFLTMLRKEKDGKPKSTFQAFLEQRDKKRKEKKGKK